MGLSSSTSTSVRERSPDSPDKQDRAEQTARLFAEIETADETAREALRHRVAVLNLELVESLARRYRGRGEADEDLRQAGYIGLMKAVNGFQPGRGTDFIRYAVPTITGEIKKYFRDCCWTIRPTRRVQELQGTISELTLRASQELGRTPTCREVAEMLQEDEQLVAQAMTAHQCYSPRSLDAPIDVAADDTLSALVGQTDLGFGRAEDHVMLRDAVQGLTEREKDILRMRFFEDLTQREIAGRIGVTQMQVSRLLAQIFSRLRAAIEPDDAPEPTKSTAA